MRVAAILCCFLLGACASAMRKPARDGMPVVKAGTEFMLALGDSVNFAQVGAIINFAKVLEDSRCPMNARCVWEGNARIALEFMEFGGDPRVSIDVTGATVELNTSSRFDTRATYGHYFVELRHLEPMPVAGAPTEGYIATLFVDRSP